MTQAGFVHSTPVPRIYKIASKVAKNVKEGKDSLKNLVYAERHVNIKALYALVVETFKRNEIIDDLIEKSELLVKEPRFNVWLAKILISELLWGKNKMTRGSKPIETILSYEEILKTLLKDCVSLEQPILKHNITKPRYVRVNTLKITLEEAVTNFRQEGWIFVPFFNKSDYEGFQNRLNLLKPDEFMKDIHIPELLIFPPKTEFYQHEAYKSGNIILQDKASCLPVHLLAPPPGSTVLDTCAAPGMKTTQLAALLQNTGTVYAVELNPRREALLKELVESVGATCIKTILKDVMQVSADDCPDVEYILVDPSCSGSGITDRVEIEKLDLSTKMERLKKLCNFQAKLLRHTMTAFPKAKRIVYSTCSMNAEENEDVVRQTLETSRQFKLIDAKKLLQSWNTKTSEIYPQLGNMCIYATPEEDKTNGFFVAVFERLEDGEKNPYLNYELCKFFDKETRKNNSQDNIQQTDEFLMNTKNGSNGNLLSSNNYQKEQNKNSCQRKKNTKEFLEDSSFDITRNKKNKRKIRDHDNHGMETFYENNCESKKCLSTENPASKEKNIQNSYVDEESLFVNESNSNFTLPQEKKKKKKANKLNEENNVNLENSVGIGPVPIRKQKKCKTANAEESENTDLNTEKLTDQKKIKQKNKHLEKTEELESSPHDERNDHTEEDSIGVSFGETKEEKKHKKSKKDNTKTETFIEISSENHYLCKEKKLKRKSSIKNMESEIVTEESINSRFDSIPPKKKKKKKDKEISKEDNGPENSSISIQVDEKKQKKSKKETDKAELLDDFDHVEKEIIPELEGNNEIKIKKKKKKKLTDDNETVPSRHDSSSELSQERKKIKKVKHSFERDVEIESEEKNSISETKEELNQKEITKIKRRKRSSDNLEDN
ncbi:putative methyltransferase NSUN7 [Coccinella septempunctata]|uniref:putative methyltransferase NSUN7 n=1 Tax=Coccinella septempunctata TaxID=41139 RepID=UPI001D063843|nr:putative methyltransferase NSUN7 [Coccinella septempunctata]